MFMSHLQEMWNYGFLSCHSNKIFEHSFVLRPSVVHYLMQQTLHLLGAILSHDLVFVLGITKPSLLTAPIVILEDLWNVISEKLHKEMAEYDVFYLIQRNTDELAQQDFQLPKTAIF